MGSGESHFNVSIISGGGGVGRLRGGGGVSTTFEEKGEPKLNRTEVLLLTSLTP